MDRSTDETPPAEDAAAGEARSSRVPSKARPIESLSEALGFEGPVVEFGPTHPGMRRAMAAAGGTAGFVVRLDDDRILDVEIEIGAGHRGFEKEAECAGWEMARTHVARLGYAGAVHAEIAYCGAVERLAGIDLPDRAIWLRMLVGELARVADHFGRLAATMASIGLRDAEVVAQQGEVTSASALRLAKGSGPLVPWCRFGGVEHALAEDFADRWEGLALRLRETLGRFERVGSANPTSIRRLREAASLDSESARAWAVTGPMLRASGVSEDLRMDRPYLAYGAVDFDVPIGETGDGLDRLLVVVEETRQSIDLIGQCHKIVSSLGPGAIDVPIDLATLPAGEAAYWVEAPTGALAFFIASDGSQSPRRIRCRAPSFFHAQALPEMLRGERLDDLLPTVALAHLVAAECDR